MPKQVCVYLQCMHPTPKIMPRLVYRIAGKFGGGKVWRIDSFRAFGERKFGKLIDQLTDY